MQPPSNKRRTGSNATPLLEFMALSAPTTHVAGVPPRSSLASHVHTHGSSVSPFHS